MWLVVAIAGCGPAPFEQQPADTAMGTPDPAPTETGAETASTCPWIGEWTVNDARCDTIIYDDILGSVAVVEAVEGEPESCGLVLDVPRDDGICAQYIQLDNPRAGAQLWDGWMVWCLDGELRDVGSVAVETDGDALTVSFEASVFPACGLDSSSVELTPPT